MGTAEAVRQVFTVRMQRQHAERSLNNPFHAFDPFFLHIKRKSHSAWPSTGPGAAGRKLHQFLVSLPCSKLHLPIFQHITSHQAGCVLRVRLCAWCEQLMPLWRVTHQASSMTPSGRALCCFSTLMASSTFPPRASGDSSRSSSSLLSISNSIPAQEHGARSNPQLGGSRPTDLA